MTSEKRILAARANGARSRGPKTPEGKARSSRNALRHGLLSRIVVLGSESRESFEDLFNLHVDRFSPVDDVELGMIEEMTAAYWRLRRAWAIESRLLESGMENRTEEGELSRMAAAFGELAATPQLGLLHRYETRLHVMYQRALHNLVLLRNSAVRNEPRKPSVSNTDADREPAESADPPAPEPARSAAPPPPSRGAPMPIASLPPNGVAFPALVEESPPRRPNLPESCRNGD